MDNKLEHCLKLFADTKVYERSFCDLRLNDQFINLATIQKDQLVEAKAILDNIQPLVV